MKIAAVIVAAGAAVASADVDLQITEMWPGNEPGENLTSDWFEITNYGDMAWDIASGALYFDDDSQDATTADMLMGITTIAPGESVVLVDDDTTTEFGLVWGDLGSVQIGTYSGSGLSQGGDGVTLFYDLGDDGVTSDDIIDFELYPDAELNGGQSFDVVLGAFSTIGNASGAFQSLLANDEGQYAIASPGSVVPVPASMALLGLGGLAAARRRR